MKTFSQTSAINLLVAQLQKQQARPAQLPCERQLSLYAPSMSAVDTMDSDAPNNRAAAAFDSPRGVRIFDMS